MKHVVRNVICQKAILVFALGKLALGFATLSHVPGYQQNFFNFAVYTDDCVSARLNPSLLT